MQQNDYKAIANVLSKEQQRIDKEIKNNSENLTRSCELALIQIKLGDLFEQTDKNFNRKEFAKLCAER